MKQPPPPVIRLRGVRHNNLKNFDLDLPVGRLIVFTGLSGSGKSSLAFDTLFAEGQRRYIETFSPYARQFFDRMDKPQVDRIEGIPPAIAIEQTNTVRTTRSTVGTMTELCDYIKILWPHLARLHCRQCGQPVHKESPQFLWDRLLAGPDGNGESSRDSDGTESLQLRDALPAALSAHREILVTFDLPLSDKLSLAESLSLIARQGYQRLWDDGRVLRVDEAAPLLSNRQPASQSLTVVQDRIRLAPSHRARFIEACEHAYHFGKGRLALRGAASTAPPGSRAPDPARIECSKGLHCAACDLGYREPVSALFSYNHPLGACPACRGFGRIITIDYNLALPDRSKTLAEGAVKPWLTGHGLESQKDLLTFCKKRKVPVDVPFRQLPQSVQQWVVEGDPDYGKDARHQWPRAWYGVKGYFRWLESKSYKMHVRVLLSRYRAYTPCPECHGRRFQPESLLYRLPFPDPRSGRDHLTLPDFYSLPVSDALAVIETLSDRLEGPANDPIRLAMNETRNRLRFLAEVGLGYLSLDRPTRSLSGGETERVNLTTCLGSRMVNTLFVLDEPSVGLHARDTERLVRILQSLRDAGNTVLVVEHEAAVMRAADQIVDLGPGQGEAGGHVVFQGTLPALLKSTDSLTAQYLNGTRQAAQPAHRPVMDSTPSLTLRGARRHNLKNLTVRIPLNRFVCLTGVSGSGKTTLVRDVLLPLLESSLQSRPVHPDSRPGSDASDDADTPDSRDATEPGDANGETGPDEDSPPVLEGFETLARVVLVDQSSLGRTPRSNPAVYVGAFEHLRALFAQLDAAKKLGLNASAFSFNSGHGQCERCRGAGFEKIEMQFLSDIFIRCPDCDGRRYRDHILEILLPVAAPDETGSGHRPGTAAPLARHAPNSGAWSIADVLEATVDHASRALLPYAGTRPGQRALARLKCLQDVGLGYLRLGQPINTLSGGECQRLKLAAHLADADAGASPASASSKRRSQPSATSAAGSLFLFDEPTTGLHFHDVRVLMSAFQRLVDAGHSLLVIEHHLDVIRSADWVLDLGPEGGGGGGALVAEGTPDQIAACPDSHTGRALATP